MTRLLLCAAVAVSFTATARSEPGSSSAAPAKVNFLRDIKPVLADKCFACHGPDDKTRKAGLRLDARDHAIRPGDSGATAIVPGKPAESELIQRVFETDDELVMPPKRGNKSLTAAEKELLKRWIAEGAEYQQHWSFLKPTRPTPPPVRDMGWAKTEIDRFILARLERVGLKPTREADKETLIRRVSFDLRGLPPTLAEVEEFLRDTAPNAYERMVDRMLASPHFGEKMAQIWLDLARFGDTSGYHFDSTRQMWLWRDWVIDAYNRNLPFDRFTVEQLAGDLLPNPTTAQRIASGFNRNTRFNEEGGADPEEFVIRYNVDRTNTLGQIWLGLTMGCAECHTHKYDPISQKEYYQLFAFFTGIKEPMVSMNHNQPLPPLLRVPTPDQEQTLSRLKRERDVVTQQIAAALKSATYTEPDVVALKPAEPVDVVWVDDDLPEGASPAGDGPQAWKWITASEPVKSGKRATKRSGPGLHQHYFTGAKSPIEVKSPADRLFAYVWLDPVDTPKSIMLQFNDGNWEHRAYWGEDKCFLAGTPDGPAHRKIGPLPNTGEWVRLEVDPAAIGLNPGSKINGMAFTQFDGLAYYDRAGIKTAPGDVRHLHSLKIWQEQAKADNKLPPEVRGPLGVPAEKRNAGQDAAIRDYYLRYVYAGTRSTFDPLNAQADELDKQLKAVEAAIPTVMVSEEMEKPRPAFVLLRGDFLQKGEPVQPDVPAVFPPLPKDKPRNRLALAEWLVSPEHPLTSRVAVNRLWAQMFGTGIVKTIGDFGTQGEFPSHPELLDWLATEFVRTGWDTKAMLKLIALSATYRQASAFGDTVPEADPNNRLLSRAPRFRLNAEEVRDNALAVSGLLSPKVGGPSVMPYQPGDFYKGKNESWKWDVATGNDLYRRGMYTFWRRTSLHPMFALFDAPSREECSVFRPRTNTPLQALVTLNDPTFVEAARVFAQRILTEGPTSDESRLVYAFRTTLARQPTPLELAALKKRYDLLKARYTADRPAAETLVKAGKYPMPEKLDAVEHAAMTGVANILLNLDETITRE